MSPKPGPTAQFCGYQEKSSENQAQERRNRLSRIQQLRLVERDNVREKCDLYQNVIDDRKGIREFEAKSRRRLLLQQQYAELVDEWKRGLINNGKAMKEAKETAVITHKRSYQKECSHRMIVQRAKERNKAAAIELSKDRIPFISEEQRKFQYTTALRDMAKVQRENAHQTAESKHAKEIEIQKQKQHDYYAHGKIIKHQVGAEQSAISISHRGPVVVHALIHRHHQPSTTTNNTEAKLVYNAELEEDVSHRRLWKRVMSELTGKKKAKIRSKAAVKVRVQHKQVDHMEDELMLLHNVDRIGSRSNRAKSADVVPPDAQSPVLLTAFERIFLLNQNVDMVSKDSDAMSGTTISSTPKNVILSSSDNKSKELSPTPKRSSSPKVVMKSNNWTVVDDSSSIDDEEIDITIENVLSSAPKWQSAVESNRTRKLSGKEETSTALKSSLDAKKLQILAPSWSAVATSGYGIESEDPVDDVEMPRGALPRSFNKDVWRNLPIEETTVEKKMMSKLNTAIDWYEDYDNNNDCGYDDDSLKVDENNYKQYFPYDEQASIHSCDAQKCFYKVHVPTIHTTESVSPAVLSPQSSYKGESIQKDHHTLTPLLISTAIDCVEERGEVDGSWLTDDTMSHRSYIEGDDDDILSSRLSSDASTDVARHDNQAFFDDSKSGSSGNSPPPYSVMDSYDRYASTESDVDHNNRDFSDEEEVFTPKPSPATSRKAMDSSHIMKSVAQDAIDDVASLSKVSTSSSSNSIFQHIKDSPSVNQSIQSEKTPLKEVAIDVLIGLADRSCELSPYPGVTEHSGFSTSDSSALSSSIKSEEVMTPMRAAAVSTLTDLMNAPYDVSRNSSAMTSPLHASHGLGSTNASMKIPSRADLLTAVSPTRQVAINSLTDLMNAPYESSRNSSRPSPAKLPVQVFIMSSSCSKSRSPLRDVSTDLTPMKVEAINTLTDLMNAPYESSRTSPSKSPLSNFSHSYQSTSTTLTRSPVTSERDITPSRLKDAIKTLTDLMNAPYESSRSTPTSRRSPPYLSPSKSPLSNISHSYLSNSTLTNSPPMHESSVDHLLKPQVNASTNLSNSPRILSSSVGNAAVSLISNDSSFDDSASDNSSSMGSDGSPVRQQQDRMVHDSLNSSHHSTLSSSTKDQSLNETDSILSRSRPIDNSASQSFHSKIIDIDSALLEINAELMNQSIVVESISSSVNVSKAVFAERVIPSSPSAASSISSYCGYDKYTDHINSAMFDSPTKEDASSPQRLLNDSDNSSGVRVLTRVQPPNPFDYVDYNSSNVEIKSEGGVYSDGRSESSVDEMPFSLLEVRAISGTKAQSPVKISNSMASERITLDHLLGNEGVNSNSNSALDLSFASSSSVHSSYMPLNANNLALTGQAPKLSSPVRHNNGQYDAARVRIREEIAGLKSHLINVVGNSNTQVDISIDSESSSGVSLGTLTKKHPLLNSFPAPGALEYSSELYAPVNSPMGLRRTLGVNYLLGSERDSYDGIEDDSLVVSDASSSRIQNCNGKVNSTPSEAMGSTYDLTPMSILSEGSLQRHLIQLSRRSNENNSASKYSILSAGNLSDGYTPSADRLNPVESTITPSMFNYHATGGTQTSLSSGSIDSQELVHDSLDDDDNSESYRL